MDQCPTCGFGLWNYDSVGTKTCKHGHRWTVERMATGNHPEWTAVEAPAVVERVIEVGPGRQVIVRYAIAASVVTTAVLEAALRVLA